MLKVLFFGIVSFLCLFMALWSAETNNSQEIKDRIQQFIIAVNQENTNELSSFWTDDAEFDTARMYFSGRQDIVEFLQRSENDLKYRKLKFSFKTNSITFPSNNTAIVEGTVEINDNDGNFMLRNATRAELVKQNGNWLIKSVREKQ